VLWESTMFLPSSHPPCNNNPILALLKRSASQDVFQKIVWGNVQKLLRIPA
jgi:hypothetical protein